MWGNQEIKCAPSVKTSYEVSPISSLLKRSLSLGALLLCNKALKYPSIESFILSKNPEELIFQTELGFTTFQECGQYLPCMFGWPQKSNLLLVFKMFSFRDLNVYLKYILLFAN